MGDPSQRIAEVVTGTAYTDLPAATITATKQFLLDSLGALVAGSTAEGVGPVVEEVAGWGGSREAAVGVFGYRLPAPSAALLNSLQIHALDFDDIHDDAGVHATVTVVPAALAVAERVGGVDGRRLITAVALGVDLACRIGLSLHYYQGWHFTTVGGYFGSAVAAAYLLGLSPAEVQHALGIVLSQAGGSLQSLRDGALTKRIQPGFASQGGIMAALLARRGVTGAKQVFTGKFGLFNLFDGYTDETSLRRNRAVNHRDRLLADLGRRFEVEGLSAKPYPCCRGNHASIDAVRELVERHGIRAEDVESVDVRLSELIFNLVGRPYRLGDNPQVDAQFNLPYAVATALLTGDVTVGDYGVHVLRQPERQALADRVNIILDRSIPYKLPLSLTIHARDGRSFSASVERMKGEPGTMTWADFRRKFDACLPYAARPLPRAGELPDLLAGLEDERDVRGVMALLTPAGTP